MSPVEGPLLVIACRQYAMLVHQVDDARDAVGREQSSREEIVFAQASISSFMDAEIGRRLRRLEALCAPDGDGLELLRSP